MSSGRTMTDRCYRGRLTAALFVLPRGAASVPAAMKFSGSYPLPWWELQLSGVFQSLPGIPVSASYVATNAEVSPTLGPVRCPAARPRSRSTTSSSQQQTFEDRCYQTDLRIIRNFRFGGTRLQVMFDAYNMFNNAGILAINTRYGTS